MNPTNLFNGLFGKIAPGMCRLSMSGNIAVHTSTGYKSYEVCYVTRSYLTRHGAGRLDGECPKEKISDKIAEDKTNTKNQHQGALRYTLLDIDGLCRRCYIDYLHGSSNFKFSLAVTHLNEDPDFPFAYFFTKNFSTLYMSDTPYAEDILRESW